MIIATAGHIDHGKTSLVKRLTGVDTDRLPEEKKRGMSIDLGFAYPRDTGAQIGFVDVPGHERFMRNMIAGVGGIDLALIVIAADDGPMPQTREHIAILEILGVTRAAIALTKIDRVEREHVEFAREQITECLAPTPFADARLFEVSNATGEGIDALSAYLNQQAAALPAKSAPGAFRMAIDRAFSVEGSGLVVTGLVTSGTVQHGDHLRIAPAGIDVRVRGLHAQNRKADQGRAGERCAINISGPQASSTSVARGMWLLDPKIDAPAARFDARITLLASEKRLLRHWTPVHLHLGAADIPARIALLEDRFLAAGKSTLAQIVLAENISALAGERFILRDQSAQRTIGGGIVTDPFARARGRTRPARIELLRALALADPAQALQGALAKSPAGFAMGEFAMARNLTADATAKLQQKFSLVIAGRDGDAFAYDAGQWTLWCTRITACIKASPLNNAADGVPLQTIKNALIKTHAIAPPTAALENMLAACVTANELQHAGGGWRMREAEIRMADADAPLWSKLAPLIDGEDLRPPTVAELAKTLAANPKQIEGVLRRAARLGLLMQIAPNRFYALERLRALAQLAEQLAVPDGFEARAFRDASNLGRNLTIEVLEHFDRMGLTRRKGDLREIRRPASHLLWGRETPAAP